MTKGLFFFLMILPFLSKGQTLDTVRWCPPGAKWVFRAHSQVSNKYFEFSYTKDTFQYGKMTKKMEVRLIEFLGPTLPGFRQVTQRHPEFFYQEGDSIFILDNINFAFLWDFSPSVGDDWVIGNSRSICIGGPFNPTDTLNVDSLSLMNYGNKSYSTIHTSSTSKNWITGRILKNIGSLDLPFPVLNRSKCNTSTIINYGEFFEGLVCYSDFTRGVVPIPSQYLLLQNCHNIITSTQEPSLESKEILFYPNPFRNQLHIKTEERNFTITIYNTEGKKVREFKNEKSPNLSNLPAGLYLISFQGKKKGYTKVMKL